jgi:hypothetical protein
VGSLGLSSTANSIKEFDISYAMGRKISLGCWFRAEFSGLSLLLLAGVIGALFVELYK